MKGLIKMSVRWSKAIWWMIMALIVYLLVFYFISGCRPYKPTVFSDGSKVEPVEVHEPDMVPEERPKRK